MKHQPSPIHSVLLAALLLGGSLVASAAENTGGQPNPPATPTWTVGATPAPSNLTIKNKSRLHDQIAAPGPNGWEDPKGRVVGVGDRDKDKPFARTTTNEICPPKCGPLGPSPTIPPAPQAAQTGGGKPIGRPIECRTPPCPGEQRPTDAGIEERLAQQSTPSSLAAMANKGIPKDRPKDRPCKYDDKGRITNAPCRDKDGQQYWP